MRSPKINLNEVLERLSNLTIFELRSEWRRHHRMSPPMRLSRDLLMRGITYKLQEKTLGGLSIAALRKLEKAGNEFPGGSNIPSVPPIFLKPGTRLVREWRGVTHSVLVIDDGIEWRGRRYRSLSVVAREITGAHWSGPRFFGLRRRSGETHDDAVPGHVEG